MDAKEPVIIVIGIIGSGKSTFCNTLSSGWTSFRYLSNKIRKKNFITFSSHEQFCTSKIQEVKVEHLFGCESYGKCIVVDCPGFCDPDTQERIAFEFLEMIRQKKYITNILFIIDEHQRFGSRANKKILAMLLNCLGKELFNILSICLNRWPMNPKSYAKAALEENYKPNGAEQSIRKDINEVCCGFNKEPTNVQVHFFNNFYKSDEAKMWKAFEYDFFQSIASKEPLNISTNIIDACNFYKDNLMQLFCYNEDCFNNVVLMQLANKVSYAEKKLDEVYSYWGSEYCSIRILIINCTSQGFEKVELIRNYGYFEIKNNDYQGLEDLENINILGAYTAIWIFQRKRIGAYSGVEALLKYGTTYKDNYYILEFFWDITRGRFKNPAVEIKGDLATILNVTYAIEHVNKLTPIVRFKIDYKS